MMTTNNGCTNTPQPGHEATSLFFTKAPGEDYYKVYARYGDNPAWVPVHIAQEAGIDLQQVRDKDRNIAVDSGSYEDAHLYLRSADGNNMTTAFFANADGGGIQSGNADGFAPLNLQPDGGTLNYGGDEVATKDWVETATIKNQHSSAQSGSFWIDGTAYAGSSIGVAGSYSDGGISIYPHSMNLSRSGNTFTFLDFQGAHSGTVLNTMDTAPLKFRYNNDWDRQMVFDQNLMIGVAEGYTSTGDRLQVNGSIKQSTVTSSMLKTDASGKLVAATAGTDYPAFAGVIQNQTSTTQTAGFNINGTGAAARMIAGTYDNGITKLSAHGGHSSGKTYGSATGSTFAILGDTGNYGSYFGVDNSSGQTWWQTGRSDGSGQLYNLTLQEAGGNVGIGGYALEKLHVYGNTKVTGSLFVDSIRIGYDDTYTRLSVKNYSSNVNQMTLGSPARCTFAVQGVQGYYGLYFGVNDSDGHSWMQGGRTDGDTSAYNIVMNAAGGNVGIGEEYPTEKLQVVGSIKQSAVTSSLLKADATGKLVAATDGTDFITPASAHFTKPIVTATGFAGDNTVGSKDTRGVNLTPQQYAQTKDVGGVTFEFKESVGDMGLPLNTSGCLALQTFTQWNAGGGGGGVHQLAYNNNDGMYWRFGASNSTVWDPWRKVVLTGGNDFIENQFSTLQPVSFKISGNGFVNQTLTAGTLKAARTDIGTNSFSSALNVQGASSALPTLGSPSGSIMSITGSSGLWGTVIGVDNGSGNTWIQAGDLVGNLLSYDIIMQAVGGRVGIGVSSASERLDVGGSIKQSAVTSSMLKADSNGKLVAAAPGTDYAAVTRGVHTIVGDGTTTSFTIPHGLGITPGGVSITPKSAVANKIWFDANGYVPSMDSSDITVAFATAPFNGVSYEYWWTVQA